MREVRKLNRSGTLPRCRQETSRICWRWGMPLRVLEIERARRVLTTKNSSKVWRYHLRHLTTITHLMPLLRQTLPYWLRPKLRQWLHLPWWWWLPLSHRIMVEAIQPQSSQALSELHQMSLLPWWIVKPYPGLSLRSCKGHQLWNITNIRFRNKTSFLGPWAETLTLEAMAGASRSSQRRQQLEMEFKQSRIHPLH